MVPCERCCHKENTCEILKPFLVIFELWPMLKFLYMYATDLHVICQRVGLSPSRPLTYILTPLCLLGSSPSSLSEWCAQNFSFSLFSPLPPLTPASYPVRPLLYCLVIFKKYDKNCYCPGSEIIGLMYLICGIAEKEWFVACRDIIFTVDAE